MRTAAKVFIIISMVLQGILILPLIIGCLAIKRLNEATKKEDLTVMGILTLLFCSLLGGIFMLCVSDNELLENKQRISEQIQENGQTSVKNENTFLIGMITGVAAAFVIMGVLLCIFYYSGIHL
ncbi:MAG: hypothetical protein SPL13_06110 [Clostridia bacterium]|nr:hypothetical protein [Clostridia bacterium]